MRDVILNIARSFQVLADPDRVFDALADVPGSVSHYPGVAALVDEGDGVFRWVMEPVGPPGLVHTVIYASHYFNDRVAGTVTWTPLEDVGNARVAGDWRIRPESGGTSVDFHTHARLSIPAPALLGKVIEGIAETTFHRQIDGYIASLMRELSE